MKKPHISNWLNEFQNRPEQIAIKYKESDSWTDLSWSDYLKKIVFLSLYLKKIKTTSQLSKTKNRIALMSNTRWEWAAFDLAIIGNQDITIPLYPNQNDDDFLYILENSKPPILILENEQNFKQFNRIKKKLSFKIEVIQIDILKIRAESITAKQIDVFLNSASKIKNEDTISIIYTSGTTGAPKGVVLQHDALVSEITEGFALFDLFTINNTPKVSLCFLPLAHVMGRIEHWGSCYAGYTIAYAESIDTLKVNLKEIKPDFLVAVPRVFEKIYSQIIAQVETQKYKKKLFEYTMNIAKQVSYYRSTHQTMGLSLILQYEVLSKIVFTPIKKAFGGQLRFAICGGAAMSEDLTRLFSLMGIDILVGYGLTETFAAVTINTQKNNQPGTVGKPIGDVEIKFAHDGEILIRSKKCMKEYFLNPESTKDAFIDDFLKTGDIGELTEDGYLKITDRKKDLIKTSGGKYIAPQKLEHLLKEEPIVSQVLIVGEQKKFVAAIINVEKDQIDQDLVIRIKNHIQNVNSKLSSFETIKKFEIVNDPWTTSNGSLTPSMKLKRKYLEKKYSELIRKIYD